MPDLNITGNIKDEKYRVPHFKRMRDFFVSKSERVNIVNYTGMMNTKKPTPWTDEERARVVALFDLLIKMDKKQNPHLYKKLENNDKKC